MKCNDVINDESYEPQEDSYLLKKYIKGHATGDVLDIGTGSGILSIEAAKYANTVIAVDINQKALKLAKKNTKNYENIIVKYSDLFSTIHGKFDLIVCNPPYLPTDAKHKDVALDGGRHGYEYIQRFLQAANGYLKPNGKILLLFSSLTKKEKIDTIIAELLFTAKQLAVEKHAFEQLYVYLIEKSALLQKLESLLVSNISYLDKGKRGIIYAARYKNKDVIIKVARARNEIVNMLEKEAKWLRMLAKYGFVPKLFFQCKEFLIIEFINGKEILDFLKDATPQHCKKVLQQLFYIMYKLDQLQLNKEEMHHPTKHIIVTSDFQPKLIDFERMHYSVKPKNFTQFCQFVSSEKVLSLLSSKHIVLNKQEVRALAQQYKLKNSPEILKKTLLLYS